MESKNLFSGFDVFQGKTEEIASSWLSMVDSCVAIQPEGVLQARSALIECALQAEAFSLPVFQAATALLLTDVLQNGEGEAVEALYAPTRRHLDTMPAQVRAALMQGFRLAHDLRYMQIDPLPAVNEMTTFPRDVVTAELMRAIGAMTLEEMQAVAQSDYGIDEARHLAALKMVVNSDSGLFPSDDPTHPADVVKWNANNPRAVGFMPCLSLVCVNTLHHGDRKGELAFLWSQLGPYLVHKPADEVQPVLNGIRHVFETDPDWSPYPSWNDLLIRGQGTALPWHPSEA
ncbi:MAG: hypothetical protein AB3N13_16420 [Arenibacterium sp.]